MPYFSDKRFNLNRFTRFLGLTFVVSALVIGGVAYLSGTADLAEVVWQSLGIAMIVGAGAGWMSAARSRGSGTGKGPEGSANDDTGPDSALDPASVALASLEEQGITIKLLELTALGDRYGNVFSVAMIRVDHLEDINGQYDRTATTQLLEKVSGALAHTLRMPDRVGEYACGTWLVVLPETDLRGALQIAERLRNAVSGLDVAVSDRLLVQTTASVGVTSFRRGDDLQSLIRRAEKALREAQNQGRNRVLPDMAA